MNLVTKANIPERNMKSKSTRPHACPSSVTFNHFWDWHLPVTIFFLPCLAPLQRRSGPAEAKHLVLLSERIACVDKSPGGLSPEIGPVLTETVPALKSPGVGGGRRRGADMQVH